MLHDMVYSNSIKKIYDTSNLAELHNKKYTYELGGKFDNNLIKVNTQNVGLNDQNRIIYEDINQPNIDQPNIDQLNNENKVSLY
jgi:hypothetical protein